MFLPGRKLEQPSFHPPDKGIKEINWLYISDRTSKSMNLIDTGADVSVVPLSASKHCQPALHQPKFQSPCFKRDEFLCAIL
ncbi:hypothetical protein NPIL_611781 [Nephila pilipes]|uniref:Peptidase A2 domain-containing protein n=1 Tax=Nephila pilipes TaxID=299642 RepID=A0A8X6PIG3_NEPPI|nr:hypothetical protein NPIL_611781 [Nephila pilipes]